MEARVTMSIICRITLQYNFPTVHSFTNREDGRLISRAPKGNADLDLGLSGLLQSININQSVN